MIQALKILTDGRVVSFEYDPRDGGSLTQLQGVVGGWIESVPTSGEYTMYCHEEGKLEGLPLNPKATKLVRAYLHEGDYIAGDVVVCGPPDHEGYDTSLDLDDTSLDPMIRKALAGAVG
jgi:hypothetical protein